MVHRANKTRIAVLLAAFCLSGCGDSNDEQTVVPQPPEPGTVQLSFSVTSNVKSSSNLVDPLVGAIYGGLFFAEDVNITGPLDGAEQQDGIDLLDVDLQTADVSAQSWKSQPLEPGEYSFLGFYDVNGDGAESKDPGPGDPVTLAITNQFVIEPGGETTFVVAFDLVL